MKVSSAQAGGKMNFEETRNKNWEPTMTDTIHARTHLKSKAVLITAAAAACFAILAIGPLLAFGAVANRINFQGRLVDPDTQNPITDPTADITFRVCDHETNPCAGGSLLWEEPDVTVDLDNGVFEVVLGEEVELSSAVFAGSPRYLEIKVENDVLSPRQRLVSAPTALRAGAAEYLEPGSTNYIGVQETLQAGATFYVSSGAVSGNFWVGGAVRFLGALTVDGSLAFEGVLVAGSGANQLTDAAGLIDGAMLQDDPAKLVPSSVIDPSSITKLGASGFVPSVLLDASSVTKLGSSFNIPNTVLRLDAGGLILPALVDGSSVTKLGNDHNLPNGPLKLDGSAFVPNDNIDGSSVTKLGNDHNLPDGPVKLDGSGKLPALDASNLTNVDDASKLPLAGGSLTGTLTFDTGSDIDTTLEEVAVSTHININGYVKRFGFFYARRTTEFDNTFAATYTQFDIDAVDVADGDFYSEAGGVVTIKMAGLYLIDTACTFDMDGGTREDGQCAVFVNGGQRGDMTCSAYMREVGKLGSSCSNHGILNLSSGDTVDMRMSGDNANVDLGDGTTEPATLRMEFIR